MGSRNRQQPRFERRIDRHPSASERNVRPPLAVRGHALDRADYLTAGHDQPQIAWLAGHELLNQRALTLEPGTTPEPAQAASESKTTPTGEDISAPAPEPWLDDDRRLQPRPGPPIGGGLVALAGSPHGAFLAYRSGEEVVSERRPPRRALGNEPSRTNTPTAR